MADLIVKKAEHTAAEIAILSIDSAQSVTFTDLESLGLTSVTFEVGISAGGGGGGSEVGPLEQYAALCDAQFHPADMPGALPNGVWMGPFHESPGPAFDDAGAHEDGLAHVVRKLGATLIGPVEP